MGFIGKETYQRKILQGYQESFGGRTAHYLSNPTPGNVKKAVLEMAGLQLVAADSQILVKGLNLDSEKPLLEQIKKKVTDDFKTLSKFLKNETKDTDHTNLDLIAVLIDFNPRPFSKFKTHWKEEASTSFAKEEKTKATLVEDNVGENFSVEELLESKILKQEKPKTGKRGSLLKLGIVVMFTFLILTVIYLFISKEEKTCIAWMGEKYETVPCNTQFLDQKRIIVQVNNGVVNINDFRQIVPNNQTTFYDNAGNPKIWYANNETGSPEFFNQRGNHPITHAPLKPVPMQLVAHYKYLVEKNGETETDGNNAEEKGNFSIKDILNPAIKNTVVTEVTVLTFSEEEIDTGLAEILSEKISEENKTSVQLFYPERFTSQQIKAFTMGDFSEVSNLESYVDAVLVATATYVFRKSDLNEKLIVCNAVVTYFQYDTKTKIKSLPKMATAIGSGFSEVEAKQNTLKKLVI
jgi:hypothetical protein